MNDNAKLWVKALRSGDYDQAFGYIKDGDKYCCLGVACAISGKELPYPPSTGAWMDTGGVAEWLGLSDYMGGYADGNSLISHNDGDRWNFQKIADLIESEPKGLFRA